MTSPGSDINIKEFYEAYSESLGLEGARKIVDQAVIDSGLPKQVNYTPADAIRICDTLKKSTGYVAIIAGFLGARFALRKVNNPRLQT
ncbi:MAG TPA: hypothetical protein V6D22_02490 [Candidatus Obscuribacterales bacterium]